MYEPSGKSAKANSPAVEAVVEYARPVAWLVALTAASGTIAPVWSVTIPLMPPRKFCAEQIIASAKDKTRARRAYRMFPPDWTNWIDKIRINGDNATGQRRSRQGENGTQQTCSSQLRGRESASTVNTGIFGCQTIWTIWQLCFSLRSGLQKVAHYVNGTSLARISGPSVHSRPSVPSR